VASPVPGLQLPTGDQGSKGSDVLAVSAVPTPPRLAVAVASSRLEGDGVGTASIPLERGKDHFGRCHKLNQVVADDFLASPGVRCDSDNSDPPGSLVRGDAHSNPRPVAVGLIVRRGW
jgi:hypothetical protein